MQYTTEQFLAMSQVCDACMVVESYVDSEKIGQELKVKGSAEDIVKMLGSLVAYVGLQIVDISKPDNFKAYLDTISGKAVESLIKTLEGQTTEEYNKKHTM